MRYDKKKRESIVMNNQNFTTATQELLQRAITLATELKNPSLTPLHTLAAGLENDFCTSFLSLMNINFEKLNQLVDNELKHLPQITGGQLAMDYATQDFLAACQRDAKEFQDTYVSLDMIMLQWATTKHLPKIILDFFNQSGFTREAVLTHIKTLRKGKNVKDQHAEKQASWHTIEKKKY